MSVLTDAYFRPLLRSLLLQIGLLVFLSLILDHGVLLQACSFSSVPFWLGVTMIILRRPKSPTAGDLAYIRWGLVFILLYAMPAFIVVWRLKNAI
jgi:hypothetical protein